MIVNRTEEMCNDTSTPHPIIKIGTQAGVSSAVYINTDLSTKHHGVAKGNDEEGRSLFVSGFKKDKTGRELVDLGLDVDVSCSLFPLPDDVTVVQPSFALLDESHPQLPLSKSAHISGQVRRCGGFIKYIPLRIILGMVALLSLVRPGSAETIQAAASYRYLQDTGSLFSGQGEGCVNLTLAFLPSFIEEEAQIEWSLMSSNISIWDKNYSDPALFNTVVTDQVSDDGVCLVPGTYNLNIATTGIATAHYIIYSEGQVIECGGVHMDSHELSITLPFDPTISNSTCSLSLDCLDVSHEFNTTTESDCFTRAFTSLQCYNVGIEVDVTAAAQNSNGDRNSWFGVSCARALNDMCASRESLGFGLGKESPELQGQSAVDEFCAYFDCGSTSFEAFLEGGTKHEFYGCGKFPMT